MSQRKQSPSHTSPTSSSFIPVMASPIPAPRSSAPRATLPSSFGLGLPQFGLRRGASVHAQGQSLSKSQNGSIPSKIPQSPTSPTLPHPRAATIAFGRGSSSPASPASSSSTSLTHLPPSAPNGKPLSNGGSNIPKFRSLRNMLPFGPKSNSSPSDSSGTPLSKSTTKASPSPTSSSPSPANLVHRRSASSIPSEATESIQQQKQHAMNKSGFLGFTSRNSFSIGGERRVSGPAPHAYASASMSSINRRRSEDPGMGYRPIPPIPSHPIISIDCPPVEEDQVATGSGVPGNEPSTPRNRSPLALKRSLSTNASLAVNGNGVVQTEGATESLSRSLTSLGLPIPSSSLRTPKSDKIELRGSSLSNSPSENLRVNDDNVNRSPSSPRQGSIASVGSHGPSPSGPGDLSTIMESELSSMSITRHIPPLDEEEEERNAGNKRVDVNEDEAKSDGESDVEDDEDGTLVLANLAKKVHARSVNMMKSESLDMSFPSVSEDTIPPALPIKDYPRLGAFRKQSGASSNASDGILQIGFDFTVDRERTPSNPLLTPSTATTASSPAFALSLPSPDADSSASLPSRVKSNGADDGAKLRSLLKASSVEDSFDLSSLDADLANLLSPNKFNQHNSAMKKMVAAVDAITPPPMSTPSNSQSDSNRSNIEQASPSDGRSVPSKRKKSKRNSGSIDSHEKGGSDRPRIFTTGLGQQSSPKRSSHSRPSSLTVSISSVTTPDARRGSLDIPIVRAAKRGTVFSREGGDGSPALDDLAHAPPARSYSALGVTSPEASFASTESLSKKRTAPKIYTPARQATTSNGMFDRPASASSVRPALKNWRRARADGSYDQDQERELTSTPMPRASSALGVTVSRRPSVAYTERSSMDRDRDRVHQRASQQSRHRKRSMSVNETRPPSSVQRRSPGDWLGPRTVRLFRNAGLLDDPDKPREREGAVSVAGSRAESRLRIHTRASIDQERPLERSLFTPSRAGYSDITRSASWGRGSIAGSMTMAELMTGRVESPITITSSTTPTSSSNPKTAFSGSTATSVSGGSPRQPSLHHPHLHLEASLASLKEKHQLEMEALLNALADSQCSGRALKEENTMLRGRIRDLEEQIRDLVDRFNSSPQPIPSSSTLSSLHRSILGNASRPGSTEPLQRRHSRMQSYVHSDSGPLDRSESEHDSLLTMRQPTPLSSLRSSPHIGRFDGSSTLTPPEHPARKRSSTSSSLFPVLPSNMSMLLHEDGDASDSFANTTFSTYQMHANGSTPSSPTAVLARPTPVNPDGKSRHAPKPSVSSIGSNSSTNPDLSVTSLPGSPGSLNLRPEHERHLGDMMSLDLSLGGESDG